MKILFITDNFPPEVNAPASRGFDHAVEWVKMGYQVTVITCQPNFPKGEIFEGYKNSLYKVKYIQGIRVVRVWSFISANEGFIKRSLDYFSFAISSFIAGVFVKTDVILATSPQFFTTFSGNLLSLFKRKPWILEIRDLWPDSIVAVGALSSDSNIYKLLKRLEGYFYRSAEKVIVVTDSFKEYLIRDHKIAKEKIGVFKNGIVENSLSTMSIDQAKNRKESLGISSKSKIISYIGTLGLAHGLEFILHCAKKLEGDNIHFLFIGDGAKKKGLIELKNKLELSNVTFIDTVPKNEVYRYLQISDYALVNLKKSDEFKNVIPSKIFENVAARKPILLGVDGESKKIIKDYNVGISYEPENEMEFLKALDQISLLLDSDQFELGCQKLLIDFDRSKIACQMGNFIKEAVGK